MILFYLKIEVLALLEEFNNLEGKDFIHLAQYAAHLVET